MSSEKPTSFQDVRMRGFRERAEVDEALALLKARLSPLSREDVGLHEAAGRVLTADIVAPIPVPPFDRKLRTRNATLTTLKLKATAQHSVRSTQH